MVREARAAQGIKSEVIQFLAPFSAFILQIWVQITLFGVGIYLFFNVTAVAETFNDYGATHFLAYRLQNVAVIGNTTLQLQLLSNGCNVSALQLDAANNDSLWKSILLPEPTAVDGFAVELSPGTQIVSPGNLELLGSNDQYTWVLAGSSHFRLVATGARFFSGNAPLAPPLAFDFRPPWPLFADAVVTPSLFALTCCATAAFGALARLHVGVGPLAGRSAFAFFCGLLSLLSLIVGVGYLSLNLPRESALPLSDCAVYAALAAALVAAENRFFDVLYGTALYSVAARAVSDCALFHDCAYFAARPPTEDILLAFVGFAFVSLRRRFLNRVVGSVRDDYARREADWLRIAAEAERTGALRRIADAAAKAAANCSPALARQLNRRRDGARGNGGLTGAVAEAGGGGEHGGSQPASLAALTDGLQRAASAGSEGQAAAEEGGNVVARGTVAGEVDLSAPVTSLDQLYSQARRLTRL